jgi:DNA mismatch repair protein MutS
MSTPMTLQYDELKKQYSDCVLLYRLGDFYEMFGEDAVRCSKILNITLTSRNKGDHKVPMCGVPYHAVENYLSKLIKNGEKVAICEQMSDPKLPGIVKREVIRVITPGTTISDNILDTKTNNYIASITMIDGVFGLAYADNSTGDFGATEIDNYKDLITEIIKLSPAECIIEKETDKEMLSGIKSSFKNIYFFEYETYKDSEESLKDHFKVKSLDGYGLAGRSKAVMAAGRLFNYLKETQKNDLKHFDKFKYFSTSEYMPIDEATLRNLELLNTLKEQKKEGSLLSVIDKTITPMGGRMIKYWLTHPLLSLEDITARLNAVEEFFQNGGLLGDLRLEESNIQDIERIMARLSMGAGNARDLVALKMSLNKIPKLKDLLKNCTSDLLLKLFMSFSDLSGISNEIENAICDDAPLSIYEGNMIKDGYSKELDEIRNIAREGKNFIKNMQEQEIKRTGIGSLKVRFNQVFGYYIEISKTNIKNVPENYIRKQTLVNAERYITPELKEYEDKILNAEEKIFSQENEIFNKIRSSALEKISEIQKNARIIAILDSLSSFAYLAKLNNYINPIVDDSGKIEIIKGRHPVIEKMTFSSDFIPNDTCLDTIDNRVLLITGPNMGGKSTILRQTALITLLAHIGCFVPAEKAVIGIVDRIFTRVGASDNLIRGQSTFMIEMQEAANILNNATNKSLIILDEIGRGTSTYDGVSIAWAIIEYIHNVIKAKTLFASHYHELISVVDNLSHAKNYCVSVKEKSDGIIFLYKLENGGINKSYGIEVAKLAGLPLAVIDKSKQILNDLEENIVDKNIKNTLHDPKRTVSEDQISLFERTPKGLKNVKDELDRIDINSLTPLEAMQKLYELKKKSNND